VAQSGGRIAILVPPTCWSWARAGLAGASLGAPWPSIADTAEQERVQHAQRILSTAGAGLGADIVACTPDGLAWTLSSWLAGRTGGLVIAAARPWRWRVIATVRREAGSAWEFRRMKKVPGAAALLGEAFEWTSVDER
jgi:hypothetical protein